jgi:AraC-like DNA-binding protein
MSPAAARAPRHRERQGPREWSAPAGLDRFVACVWEGGTGPARVLPDGCVDVIWSADRLVVAGPATAVDQAGAGAGDRRLGVRFRVGLAGAALGVPARRLRDATVPLEELWGRDATRLAGEVARGGLEALVRGVARRLPSEGDALVRAAVLAVARGAAAGVPDLGRALGLGERQLRRRFDDEVGYGPAMLRRVLRLQRFLTLDERHPGASLARLAAEAGYADQAHLARDCRALAGAAPSALRAAGARAAGERTESSKAAVAPSAMLAS